MDRFSAMLGTLAGCVLLGACVGMLSGCATHDGSGAVPPAPMAGSTSVTAAQAAQASAEAAALSAYNDMWVDEQSAALTAAYQSPLMEQHATGSALSILVRGLYSLRLQHLVIKGQLNVHARVTSLAPKADPTTATILDCSDETHWLVYKASGGLQNNIPGGHRRITATVEEAQGVWKVAQLNTGADGSC